MPAFSAIALVALPIVPLYGIANAVAINCALDAANRGENITPFKSGAAPFNILGKSPYLLHGL